MILKRNIWAIVVVFVFMSFSFYGCKKDEEESDDINTEIKDGDGNIYNYVEINSLKWLTKNLKTTTYSDGSAISNPVQNQSWQNTTSGAYAWYGNDPANKNTYGALYNWYVVSPQTNGGKNICPEGWRVPSDIEWLDMVEAIGCFETSGGKLKNTGTNYWNAPNTGATNEKGFNALPGGARQYNGGFNLEAGQVGYWWTSSDMCPDNAWGRSMEHDNAMVNRTSLHKKHGFSIRCVK